MDTRRSIRRILRGLEPESWGALPRWAWFRLQESGTRRFKFCTLLEGINVNEVLSEEDCGSYILRKEIWTLGRAATDATEMEAAYSKIDGSYIGDKATAELLKKRGISPQAYGENKVSSIGFSEKEGKWFGWSHRAICGFKPGDVVESGDVVAGAGPSGAVHEDVYTLPVGFRAKTLDDAKKMAIAFAHGVS